MRQPPPWKLALILASFLAGSAHAGRPLKEFTPPPAPTAEGVAVSKERSKSNLDSFQEDPSTRAEPLPRALFGLVAIFFKPDCVEWSSLLLNTAQCQARYIPRRI